MGENGELTADKEGWNAFHLACYHGSMRSIELILNKAKALDEDDANGEDLEAMTTNFQASGTTRPLQKLLNSLQHP